MSGPKKSATLWDDNILMEVLDQNEKKTYNQFILYINKS